MKRTPKNYEAHLNELYSDIYSAEEAADHFAYLNSGKIKRETIIIAHGNYELGTLMRKHDPIGFNAGHSEWSKG
jgi:hypothetical protein